MQVSEDKKPDRSTDYGHLKINRMKFFVEIIGTFVLVIVSAGPDVLNAKYVGTFGLWFIALCPAVGVGLAIRAFSKISMAH